MHGARVAGERSYNMGVGALWWWEGSMDPVWLGVDKSDRENEWEPTQPALLFLIIRPNICLLFPLSLSPLPAKLLRHQPPRALGGAFGVAFGRERSA